MRAILLTLLLASLTGCTLYGVKKPATLKSTSSAEQYERILWSEVQAGQWQQVPGLLSNNVLYSIDGRVMGKDRVVQYLQSGNISGLRITDMVVKPNGPDMTLHYTLQLSRAGGPPKNFTAVSVWQQVGSDWILIAHMEQAAGS